jgi:hypothetical protein
MMSADGNLLSWSMDACSGDTVGSFLLVSYWENGNIAWAVTTDLTFFKN